MYKKNKVEYKLLKLFNYIKQQQRYQLKYNKQMNVISKNLNESKIFLSSRKNINDLYKNLLSKNLKLKH